MVSINMRDRVRIGLAGGLAASMLCIGLATPAGATTMKECSAKYKAAKADGSLAGASWKSFRAANCASTGSPAASGASAGATSAATAAPAGSASMAAPTSRTPATAPMAASSMATGTATFPNAVSSKYAQESAGKARMHTCLDQYKANKAAGGNGGLHWIQKGGGYYSECTKKLKG